MAGEHDGALRSRSPTVVSRVGPPRTSTARKVTYVVDDSEDARELFGDALRDVGYRVVEARDGKEVVDLLLDHPSPTAIVLDLRRIDGSTVDIDELRPEVRAVVRALLAEVNEHGEDTSIQLGLALDGAGDGLIDGVTLVLLWTVSAMSWCEDHDEPAPGWLATTAA